MVSYKRFKIKCIFPIREHIKRSLHISSYGIGKEIGHKCWSLPGGLQGRCSNWDLLQEVSQKELPGLWLCTKKGVSLCAACQSQLCARDQQQILWQLAGKQHVSVSCLHMARVVNRQQELHNPWMGVCEQYSAIFACSQPGHRCYGHNCPCWNTSQHSQ